MKSIIPERINPAPNKPGIMENGVIPFENGKRKSGIPINIFIKANITTTFAPFVGGE